MVFFFNDTATTEIYTLSLHDALPILLRRVPATHPRGPRRPGGRRVDSHPARQPAAPVSDQYGPGRPEPHRRWPPAARRRSEEHTSELQSRQYLVCRLLLEKKKREPTI